MSNPKGMGPVQRRIWRAFVAHPDRLFRTADLVPWVYPRLGGAPERKHRLSIVRAARRVAIRVRRDRPGGVVFRARKDLLANSQSLPSDG